MNFKKIPIQVLTQMHLKGFIEINPYIHNNPLVRWIFWKRIGTMLNFSGKGERVLDFGAGSGVLTLPLSEHFKEVFSIDGDTRSLNFIKDKYKLQNVSIIQNSNESLPFKDNFFDVIFAADVLEHFKDSTNILKEFRRVLKENGSLIVSGPTENSIYKLSRKILYRRKQDSDHYANINDIIEKTSKHFKIEKIKILPNPLIQGFKIYRAKKII
jgi:ubiquinone/menaquinone biosynthesis C-methylase UbiE